MSSESPTAPSCCATRASRYAWFASLAVVGCTLDLITKSAVFSWLGYSDKEENIYWLVKDYVGIETALNRGALFGAGQGLVWFFCLMSFLALAGIVYWLVRKRAVDDWLLTVTLGIITGGILGNLYDRLGLWSSFQEFAVRDWIRFSYAYDRYVWPNFNVADSLLVCGAALLVWHSFRHETAEPAS
jgi:signal peptidase II